MQYTRIRIRCANPARRAQYLAVRLGPTGATFYCPAQERMTHHLSRLPLLLLHSVDLSKINKIVLIEVPLLGDAVSATFTAAAALLGIGASLALQVQSPLIMIPIPIQIPIPIPILILTLTLSLLALQFSINAPLASVSAGALPAGLLLAWRDSARVGAATAALQESEGELQKWQEESVESATVERMTGHSTGIGAKIADASSAMAAAVSGANTTAAAAAADLSAVLAALSLFQVGFIFSFLS